MAARTQRPAAIAVGDRVPKLELPSRDGRPVALRHRAAAGGAVVFSCALLHELHEVTRGGASACLPSSPATPRRSG